MIILQYYRMLMVFLIKTKLSWADAYAGYRAEREQYLYKQELMYLARVLRKRKQSLYGPVKYKKVWRLFGAVANSSSSNEYQDRAVPYIERKDD